MLISMNYSKVKPVHQKMLGTGRPVLRRMLGTGRPVLRRAQQEAEVCRLVYRILPLNEMIIGEEIKQGHKEAVPDYKEGHEAVPDHKGHKEAVPDHKEGIHDQNLVGIGPLLPLHHHHLLRRHYTPIMMIWIKNCVMR